MSIPPEMEGGYPAPVPEQPRTNADCPLCGKSIYNSAASWKGHFLVTHEARPEQDEAVRAAPARERIEAIERVITEWAGPYPTGTGMTDEECIEKIAALVNVTGQPTAPRTDCEHRTVEGLTNWTSDGEGDTKPDGVYWYCKSCGIEFTPKAAAASVPAPEQDEAIRARHSYADGRLRPWDTCPDENHARDLHAALATPPPVPAAPGHPATPRDTPHDPKGPCAECDEPIAWSWDRGWEHAAVPAAPDEDDPMHTDEEYIEYGAMQYRRGKAQAQYEASIGAVPAGAVPAAPPLDVDALRSEIEAHRSTGVTWEPPIDAKTERSYAEGYDRGMRDVLNILARLSPVQEEAPDA